jgi:hypothetical protein
MGARVRSQGRFGELVLYLGDNEVGRNDASQWVAHIDQLGGTTASAPRQAMLKLARAKCESAVLVSDTPLEWFDPEESFVLPASFHLVEGDLFLRVTVIMRDEEEDDARQTRLIERTLKPLLLRQSLQLEHVERDWYRSSPGPEAEWVFHLHIRCTIRGRSMAQLLDAGLDCSRLLESADTGSLTRETVADLVRGGHVDLLVGQPEGEWLEVKRQEPPRGDEGKCDIARAVGRFCNGSGGVVLYGLASRKVDGLDVISKLHPFPRRTAMANDYRVAVRIFLYPVPEGLSYDVVDCLDGVVLMIEIPNSVRISSPF